MLFPLKCFAFIVRVVCKLLLAIQEYDFDLDSGCTRGGGGSYFCTFVTSKRFKNAFGWSAVVSREDEPVPPPLVFSFVTTLYIFQSMPLQTEHPITVSSKMWQTHVFDRIYTFFPPFCLPCENWHPFIRSVPKVCSWVTAVS